MPFDFDQPQPLQVAIDTISAKTPVGTALKTAEIAKLPRELREAAMFSARVESARAMQEVKDALGDLLSLERDAQGAFKMDRSKFIETIQKTANRLGLRTREQEKRGSVEDFGSERRLRLIYEQQVGAAQARAFYLQGQDPDVLDAWPAQELVRVRDSKVKRDWKRRWTEAGGPGHPDGRMIALKTDPVWRKLSRFERPYPPFDFNSGMGVEEIDREEAEARGLLAPGDVLTPDTAEAQPAASLDSLDPELRAVFERDTGLRPVRAQAAGSAPADPPTGQRPVSRRTVDIGAAMASADPLAAMQEQGFSEVEARAILGL